MRTHPLTPQELARANESSRSKGDNSKGGKRKEGASPDGNTSSSSSSSNGNNSNSSRGGGDGGARLNVLREKRQKHLRSLEESITDAKQELKAAPDKESAKHAKDFLDVLQNAHAQVEELNNQDGSVRRKLASVSGGGGAGGGGRKLLHYYGDSDAGLKVHTGSVFSWLKTWENIDFSSPRCVENIEKFEARLNRFGYSLKNLTHFEAPEAFRSHYLLPY